MCVSLSLCVSLLLAATEEHTYIEREGGKKNVSEEEEAPEEEASKVAFSGGTNNSTLGRKWERGTRNRREGAHTSALQQSARGLDQVHDPIQSGVPVKCRVASQGVQVVHVRVCVRV